MNLTVCFSSSKSNLYPRRRLRTPKRVTLRTWKIWVVCGAKVMTRTRVSVRRPTISSVTWHDSDNYPSIT
jgi:hypothetical protein